MTLIQKYFLLLVGILPLISPVRVDLDWINVSPDLLKLGVGMIGTLLLLIWWLASQHLLSKTKVIKTTLYIPLIGFLIWCFTTLLWVEDWNLAIVMLAQYLTFAMAFVLFLNIFLNFDNGRSVLKVLVWSMVFVSIVGLLQYYFINNEVIQNLYIQTAKPGSTFVNKNMASHFIAMTLPLSFVLFVSAQKRVDVYIYTLTTFIGSWFLIYTVARQAYLAVSIELVVVLIFFALDFFKNKHNSFVRTAFNIKTKTITFIFILLSLFFVSNLTPQGWDFDSKDKLNQVKRINIGDGHARLPAWANTVEMIKDNPISGVGIGQWQTKYPLYYDKVMKDVIFNENIRLKRLHNEYLEVLANFGIIGYAFLLWIALIIIKLLWRILLNVDHRFRVELLGVSLGLIGFSIVAMFSFPLRVFLPGFLLMIFFALVVLGSKEELLEVTPNRVILKFFIVFFVLLASYVSLNSYKWVMAEKHYLIAQAFEELKRNELAAGAGLESLSLNRYSPDYYSITGRNLFKSGRVKESMFFFKKSVDISPFDTKNLLDLALVYNSLGNVVMEKKVLDLMIRVDPKNVIASAQLFRILFSTGKKNNAEIMYSNLKNNFIYFMNRDNFGPYNDEIGGVAMSVGDFVFAEFVYQDALNNKKTFANYVRLATVKYYNLKKKKEAVILYKKALKLKPNALKDKEIQALIDEYESTTN